MSRSDGSTADYYVLPEAATQLQDLISHRDMNSQIGEIFRACYRYGIVSHSDKMRDAKKIRFYAQAEIERLEKLSQVAEQPSHIISDIPSWDDAPEWAMWLAQDGVAPFAWVFYEHEPTYSSNSWLQRGGRWENTGPAREPANSLETLIPRPARTAQ